MATSTASPIQALPALTRTSATGQRAAWLPWAGYVLLACVLLLPGTASLPLLDRDEPRFARATVEMAQRGDWIVPWFNGEYRFDKPPLTYWFMALDYRLLGVGELGARLHSLLASLGVGALLVVIGRRWFSRKTGWLAGVLWISCLQVLFIGRLALADMLMVACVVAACGSAHELLARGAKAYGAAWWTLWISLGLGFLAKGPIAWAVPAVTVVLYRLLRPSRRWRWSPGPLLSGMLVTLLLVSLWGLPAILRTDGEVLRVGLGRHVVQRGLEAFDGRPWRPWYYFVTVWFSLFPWSLGLPRVGRLLRTRWDDTTRWLLAWAAAPFLIFTLYSTQLPHYVLPGFPAVMLLLARSPGFLVSAEQRTRKSFWGPAAATGALLLALFVTLSFVDLPGQQAGVLATGRWLVIALLGLLGFSLGVRARLPALALAALLVQALGFQLAAAHLREVSVGARVAELLEAVPEGARRTARGYHEPSLVFYGGGPWEFEPSSELPLESGPAGPRVFVRQLEQQDLASLIRAEADSRGSSSMAAPLPGRALGSAWSLHEVAGWNPARSRWVRLEVGVYAPAVAPPTAPSAQNDQ